jgi:hypothetical protein
VNVAFHELTGIALAHEAAGRPGGGARRWAITCALAVASHGVLDALPHYYPLPPWVDAFAALVLVLGALALVPRGVRLPLFLVCLSALLPDIVDHAGDDLRKHLGIPFPQVPNLFPWHWPRGSGSWRGRSGPDWLISWVNHGIVLAFCAAAILRNRHLWRGRAQN